MGGKPKYSDEEFVKAIAESTSIRQTLIKLGLKPVGGNYATAKNKTIKMRLDVSHHTGKGWNKGGKFVPTPAKPLDEILVENSTYQSYKLKNRLYKTGLARIDKSSCRKIQKGASLLQGQGREGFRQPQDSCGGICEGRIGKSSG